LNNIGAATLKGSRTDPNFNASDNALYYVRVLEIPTPCWSTYDAVKYNLESFANFDSNKFFKTKKP
jgi:hypothetical protein